MEIDKKGRNSKLFSDDEANEFVLKMHRLHRQRLGDNVSDAAKDEAEEEDDDSSDVAREEPRYKTQLLERIRDSHPKVSSNFPNACSASRASRKWTLRAGPAMGASTASVF